MINSPRLVSFIRFPEGMISMPRLRRSMASADVPPIVMFFLLVPWYVGPIVALLAYSLLQWVMPWFFPLPKAEPKTAEAAVTLVFATFAHSSYVLAPIAAGLILFVWFLAELLKLMKNGIQWTSIRKPQAALATTVLPRPMKFPKRQAPDNRSGPAGQTRSRSATTITDPARIANPIAPTSRVTIPAPGPVEVQHIDISEMTWKDFERLLVQVVRQFGFKAEHTGRRGPDGGIDIRCTNSKGKLILVQCKHWHHREVGVAVVREFFGVLVHEKADRGLIVTSGLFTQDAKKFAEGKSLKLVDGERLLKILAEASEGRVSQSKYRISHLEQMISTEPCPRCGGRMIRKQGRRGLFLSCELYPDCQGARNL